MNGLYDPRWEHDGCGVACIARLGGVPEHDTVTRAIRALVNLEHRGAAGADPDTGDGAGILIQIPDEFFRAVVDSELPPPGSYGVGVCFLPRDPCRRREVEELIERTVMVEGQRAIGWRDVPVDERHAGAGALACAPVIRQLFVGAHDSEMGQHAFERKLYVIRRVVENEAGDDVAFASLSSRTMVLKGMLAAPQLARFFPDLTDERMKSALAVVHSRFSTNTFPSWKLAHPYRMIAHNGEFNTLRGNVNWMRAREAQLECELFGGDLKKVLPAIVPGNSDSASFDNVLELLVLSGRSLPQALMMMVPEAWERRDDLPQALAGFYEYHSHLMEPWDGPASIAFSDGRMLGATLDRNGLRPGRWAVTDDGWVTLASETGAFELDPKRVVRRGRLRPGSLFVVDVAAGEVMADREMELEVAMRRPYARWAADVSVPLDRLPAPERPLIAPNPAEPDTLRKLFGYTREELDVLIAPMATSGKEANGSMGNDAPLAVLSAREPPLFSYFKQLFAQVTNPAIDPVREEVVMSLTTLLGRHENLLADESGTARRIVLERPLLTAGDLSRVTAAGALGIETAVIDATWPAGPGGSDLEPALESICEQAADAVERGVGIVVLSDRKVGPDSAPIPALLAVAAVHHHLVRAGMRLRTALVVDSGDPREVHHLACLVGYGADAVHPWLMLRSIEELAACTAEEADAAAIEALDRGLLKTMSKMGISTVASYRGAQAFEAIGLAADLVAKHFGETSSRVGGIGLGEIGQQVLNRHRRAYEHPEDEIEQGGVYRWRRGGEQHLWNPDTIVGLQRAVRHEGDDPREEYRRYRDAANEDAARRGTLRGLLRFSTDQEPVPIDEVEPVAEIVKRFATGAMSLGSISPETHETLAVAMNRLGGKSNTGEGGEDARRFTRDDDGELRRSAIKQVASARFGVTIDYLVNADELQIKVAQGSKPGEGGQLPGGKVDDYIGKLRHSTPGVELISPPPHHDIYSIEDLKQLIHDLRCANPNARISVKLASELGVGTVAAGVAKALSHHIVIAGHDGGTGASALSSIQSAGAPWELGLADTQQTLVRNDLRGRVVLQADGQMKTGRDVVVAALLGAEEMGFSTAPLISLGCIMMRVCHLNTCPVGIATQDPELRRRYAGKPEHVTRFFVMVAEEVRELMAALGVRRFHDLVGRVDLLEADDAVAHWRSRGIDLSALLAAPDAGEGVARRAFPQERPELDQPLDNVLLEALEGGGTARRELTVTNVDRAVGGLLSGAIARRHGAGGLREGSARATFTGSAGQSFGAWLAPGVEFTLYGDANDYVGKGLSGGTLALTPDRNAVFRADHNVIAGNACLYGATEGRAFFRGLVGERFAVRNSGAAAVVEGVGDHGCEYMTGGTVVVLGVTGRNFAAGMSGGVAYVYDTGDFEARCNTELVGLERVGSDDERELRGLLAEHANRTGSPLAARILGRWEDEVGEFVKVMPHDYKRVLEERDAERAADAA